MEMNDSLDDCVGSFKNPHTMICVNLPADHLIQRNHDERENEAGEKV